MICTNTFLQAISLANEFLKSIVLISFLLIKLFNKNSIAISISLSFNQVGIDINKLSSLNVKANLLNSFLYLSIKSNSDLDKFGKYGIIILFLINSGLFNFS